ncbi:hypothetical protein MC64_015975 [Aeromonas caviae]|nr:hypothetical protein MC64_015975 [Aeromonas caviae]
MLLAKKKDTKEATKQVLLKAHFLGCWLSAQQSQHMSLARSKYNKPLKHVTATKSVACTGLANARRLAGR